MPKELLIGSWHAIEDRNFFRDGLASAAGSYLLTSRTVPPVINVIEKRNNLTMRDRQNDIELVTIVHPPEQRRGFRAERRRFHGQHDPFGVPVSEVTASRHPLWRR